MMSTVYVFLFCNEKTTEKSCSFLWLSKRTVPIDIVTTQRYSHLDQNDKSIPANMIETKFNMSFISNDNKKEQIYCDLDKCSK